MWRIPVHKHTQPLTSLINMNYLLPRECFRYDMICMPCLPPHERRNINLYYKYKDKCRCCNYIRESKYRMREGRPRRITTSSEEFQVTRRFTTKHTDVIYWFKIKYIYDLIWQVVLCFISGYVPEYILIPCSHKNNLLNCENFKHSLDIINPHTGNSFDEECRDFIFSGFACESKFVIPV